MMMFEPNTYFIFCIKFTWTLPFPPPPFKFRNHAFSFLCWNTNCGVWEFLSYNVLLKKKKTICMHDQMCLIVKHINAKHQWVLWVINYLITLKISKLRFLSISEFDLFESYKYQFVIKDKTGIKYTCTLAHETAVIEV